MNDGSRNSATGKGNATGKSPGEQLRHKRNARKLDLHSAARDLRVDTWILEALEEDNYASIGAPIFVKGHLRNYARLLGLPADDLAAASRCFFVGLTGPPLVVQPARNTS